MSDDMQNPEKTFGGRFPPEQIAEARAAAASYYGPEAAAEIKALREQVRTLIAERDEADRRAGAAERRLENSLAAYDKLAEQKKVPFAEIDQHGRDLKKAWSGQ